MSKSPQTRRELLTVIGAVGGGLALYNAMTSSPIPTIPSPCC
jgi:hypothetical protein